MKIQKLTPAVKNYIWGGTRLIQDYGKKTDAPTLSETWELSFHPDGLTLLDDGTPLADAVTRSEWGTNLEKFENFPQLIKLIDAGSDLSVQVHPSDEYALAHENSYGKTEMWYIVDAAEGAGIYLGFKEAITPAQLEAAIQQNTLTALLNFFPVTPGECYFIPAGTIHAIGKGCLICEVQQNSNITYRVYDYGRTDAAGNPRELHVEKAKAVSDLSKFEYTPLSRPAADGEVIAECKYFTAKKLAVSGEKTLTCDESSFKFLICLKGSGTLEEDLPLTPGTAYFIPAGYGSFTLKGDALLLTSEV